MSKKSISSMSRILIIYFAMTLLLVGLSLYLANAVPMGATTSGASVDSGPTSKLPGNRTDDGGEIITLTVTAEQQTDAWKAYVGNITGTYVLQDSDNASIYEWPMSGTMTGEVYLSRNVSVNFTSGSIQCANTSTMNVENTFLGISSSVYHSVNGTFNATNHTAFTAGTGNSLSENSCPSIATWINDTAQADSNASLFQEVALFDGRNLLYAALINDNQQGYDNASSFDFQAIIPENETGSGTTYFFYAEIGS